MSTVTEEKATETDIESVAPVDHGLALLRELDEAQALAERGDMKTALYETDRVRRAALVAEDLPLLEQVLALARRIREQTEGKRRFEAGRLAYIAREDLRFVGRKQATAEGRKWIDPYPPTTAPGVQEAQPPAQGRLADLPASVWWAAGSIALMVVGAFGPWVSVLGGTTINGTDGSRDGWLVFGAAVLAALLLLRYVARRRAQYAIGAMLVGLASAATAAYDITDTLDKISTGNDLASIKSLIGNEVVASLEWGIYVSQAASVSLALASLVLAAQTRRKRETSNASRLTTADGV